MKENKYDQQAFFNKYSQMERSRKGLAGAGEWHVLKELMPDLLGIRMLDLGCGYGWHCIYAAEQGAASVVGIDPSRRMLQVAREKNHFPQVSYLQETMENVEFPPESFDLVFSSLALHYVEDYRGVVEKVWRFLRPGGSFLFSAEHPVFTAQGSQDWEYGPGGEIRHFPVDRYYIEGWREANFLGEKVVKYHRTLTTYLEELRRAGFQLERLVEPQPSQEMMESVPGMRDELRRPMMLIVSARKQGE